MDAMTLHEAREAWDSVTDSAIRDKPVFIKGLRGTLMLASTETVEQLLSDVKFTADAYTEANGSVTLSLREIDIIENGKDMDAAKSALAGAIAEYAQDYYDAFALYSQAPNRRSHLPYVIKALAAKSPKELEEAILCCSGKP